MSNVKLSDYLAQRGEMMVDAEQLDAIVKPIKKGAWKPNLDGDYWFPNDAGEIVHSLWSEKPLHLIRYDLHNCFPSHDAALHEAERRRVTAELQRLAEDAGGVEWTRNEPFTTKYRLYYKHSKNIVCVDYNDAWQSQGTIYFPSEQSARDAVQKIGEERIKRYIFGIQP